VQKGGIPIWLGAAPSPRNARRIAELCEGWMPITTDLAALRKGVARLREAFATAGRDPAELRVRAHAASTDDLSALAAAGVTVVAFALARHARRFDEITGFLERVAGARG
jgi:alkanesulfonate monooxygenase SsuD/methylene tetrahydromethanopterin reductase-like flavin-dependent oxidoreductase (luciferase family)